MRGGGTAWARRLDSPSTLQVKADSPGEFRRAARAAHKVRDELVLLRWRAFFGHFRLSDARFDARICATAADGGSKRRRKADAAFSRLDMQPAVWADQQIHQPHPSSQRTRSKALQEGELIVDAGFRELESLEDGVVGVAERGRAVAPA